MDLENSVGQDGYPEKSRRETVRVEAARTLPGMKCCYLSVRSGNVLWLSSQVMVAGGLEVTTQENLATEPSVAAAGAGCEANPEIPAKKHQLQPLRRV